MGDCSRGVNWLFTEVTECGIVENLLLLQCEDRLAGPLCGHLETTPPEDVEKSPKRDCCHSSLGRRAGGRRGRAS